MSTKICMWSGPRNLSTAMMRSFGSRADCEVWDEPFFAPYLDITGKDHPGREETLAAHETSAHKVAERCRQDVEASYHFLKLMPHHMLPSFPMDWAAHARHFFLLREPARVIASYAKGRAVFAEEDLGFSAQRKLYDDIAAIADTDVAVIDSADILRDPGASLTALCAALDIPFDPAMLSWEKGPRPEDGAWAPYWYASVENSTGFARHDETPVRVPTEYADILASCEQDYHYLAAKKLRF